MNIRKIIMKKPDILTNKEYYGIVVGTLLIVLAGIWISMNVPPTNFVNWIAVGFSILFLVAGILVAVSSVRKIKKKFLELENEIKNKKIDSSVSKDNKPLPNGLNDIQTFDTRIIALVLAVVSGLIYTRIFENEFFKDIMLIAIPSILVLLGSKWITNLWQIKKTKIEMKKEVLKNFQKSSKRIFVLMDTFTLTMLDHYADYHDLKELPKTGKIEIGISKFPKDKDELPWAKFGSEFKEIKKEIEKTRFDSSRFISSIRLFYNSEKLEKEFNDIARQLKYLFYVVERIAKSQKKEEILKLAKHYTKKSDEIKLQIKTLEKNLIKSRLYAPNF